LIREMIYQSLDRLNLNTEEYFLLENVYPVQIVKP
jgi:hypothetical protein